MRADEACAAGDGKIHAEKLTTETGTVEHRHFFPGKAVLKRRSPKRPREQASTDISRSAWTAAIDRRFRPAKIHAGCNLSWSTIAFDKRKYFRCLNLKSNCVMTVFW
jgi:hypothetical protein